MLQFNIKQSKVAEDKHIKYVSDEQFLLDIEAELRQEAAENKHKRASNYYLDTHEFAAELCLSKRNGQLTDKCVKMFQLLIFHIQRRLFYKDKDIQADCASEAMLTICANWQKYDISRSPNAFSFFTTTILNAMAKGWNINSKPGVHIPIDALFQTHRKD